MARSRKVLTAAIALALPLSLAGAQSQPGGGDPPSECGAAQSPLCATETTCLDWQQMPDGQWVCSRWRTTYEYYL